MPQLNNGPEQFTVLQLQARKSFALGIFVVDKNEHPLDINAATLRIVMRKKTSSAVNDDSANLIQNSQAINVAPLVGYARFNLQASDLDHTPGEYEFGVTLISEGYSQLIIAGVVDLVQNPEFSSLSESYNDVATVTNLTVQLRDSASIKVSVGPGLAPGEAVFTTDLEQKLLEMYAGLAAAGLTLNAGMIPDGGGKVMMTVAERNLLANLNINVGWDDVSGKPSFGSASLASASDFLPSAGIGADKTTSGVFNNARVPKVFELRGFEFGTGDPVGLPEGHLYFEYEP